jgi:hypothetical protein
MCWVIKKVVREMEGTAWMVGEEKAKGAQGGKESVR